MRGSSSTLASTWIGIALRNPDLDSRDTNFTVQRLIDRIDDDALADQVEATLPELIQRGVAVPVARKASTAYCKVMPYLSDYESIRKFIACAAHGILIGAIPQKRANQLLYAAQVAHTTVNKKGLTKKSAAK